MKDLTELPDPKKHKYISFVKSALRILAGFALIAIGYQPELASVWFKVSGGLFVLAECLGIAEEMV